MDALDDYVRYLKQLSILVSLGLITNLIFACLIWSRKLVRRPIVIFMTAIIVNDVLMNLDFIRTAHWFNVKHDNLVPCKILHFFNLTLINNEPILLVASLIVFTIRPKISIEESAKFVITILCAAIIISIPETLDAEVKDSYGLKICYSELSFEDNKMFFAIFLSLILPVIVLIGIFVVHIVEKILNREIIKKSNDYKMLRMTLILYVILVGPQLIKDEYSHEIYEYFYSFYYDYFSIIIINDIVMTIATLDILYKPFLIYFMNEDVKSEIDKLFRSTRDKYVELDISRKYNDETVLLNT